MTPGVARFTVWMAAIVAMAVTASLGLWQLRRADEKQQAQITLLARQNLPTWQAFDWPCDGRDATSLPLQRTAHVQGTWLSERTVWLENRPQAGRTGFDVVTPLRLHAPGSACHHRVLLVQRGWAPRDQHDRRRVPTLPSNDDLVIVPGRVVDTVSRVYQLGPEPMPTAPMQPLIRQNVDAAFWQAWLGQSPLPGVLLQVHAESGGSPAELQRQWPAPDLGRDKHLGYAAQWFALSALVAVLTLWFQIFRPRRLARRSHHAAP